jgi:hypothetical protein
MSKKTIALISLRTGLSSLCRSFFTLLANGHSTSNEFFFFLRVIVSWARSVKFPAEPGGLFPERRYLKRIPRRIALAVPISFFKSISMIFGGAGLIFEGLTNGCKCRNHKFCQGLHGVNPQRSNQSVLLRHLFWEMLLKKEPGTAFG